MSKFIKIALTCVGMLCLPLTYAEPTVTSKMTKCACERINPIFKETTFAIIKPEAIRSGNSGDIIKHIELNGFTIKDMVKKSLTQQDAKSFYKEHKDKPFFKDLVTYMTSGPVILLALEKENAVADWRKLMGPTDPTKAEVGTLRKMFGNSMQENAVHGSANADDAKNELAFLEKQKTMLPTS